MDSLQLLKIKYKKSRFHKILIGYEEWRLKG
jgi:hypothetical protein